MEEIYLTIYSTSFGQNKDGLITDIRTENHFEGVVDSIAAINLKVAEIATESLELITHCDWTLTAGDTEELYYGQELLTYQYDLKASSPGDTNHKVVYYAVLDGISEGFGTGVSELLATTKPPKAEMPRLPKKGEN